MADLLLNLSEYLDAYDEDHESVTLYIIQVKNLKTNEKYELKKRYSDFLVLHSQLCNIYPNIQKFHFPRKTILNTPSNYVKTYRKEAFNYYLQVNILTNIFTFAFNMLL